MDLLIDLFLKYGYWGMLVAGFLAGSFVPFSSEAVMAAFDAAGLSSWGLMVMASIGNVAGGLFNYAVGRLGREDWIYRGLRVRPDRMGRAMLSVRRHGVWMGFLAWVPILGSVITIAMGMLRVNLAGSIFTITIGKVARYAVLAVLLDLI